jgi:hypothetical protein
VAPGAGKRKAEEIAPDSSEEEVLNEQEVFDKAWNSGKELRMFT